MGKLLSDIEREKRFRLAQERLQRGSEQYRLKAKWKDLETLCEVVAMSYLIGLAVYQYHQHRISAWAILAAAVVTVRVGIDFYRFLGRSA